MRSGGGQSQWCAHIWLWGPVASASVGVMMVTGAHVVGRPRKAAKVKTNNGSLLKLMSIEVVMLSNHFILCFLFPFLSVFLNIRVFSNELVFSSRGQSIVASASASVLSINIQGWFPLGLTGLISLLSKELSIVFSSTTVQKHLLRCSDFFVAQLSLPYMTTGKPSFVLVINSFRGKICCICLQSRSLWTVIPPAMWLLLVLCSSFLCLAISIRLAQLCKSVGSEPEAGLSYGAPKG